MERKIRYSELKRFKRCRRSWMNGYLLGLRLPEFDGERQPKIKRDAGTLVHQDLENYAKTGELPGEWISRQTPPESPTFAKDWQEVYTLARIMLEGYREWLATEGFEHGERTVESELELEVPLGEILGDEVILVVHIDRLIYDETWDKHVIEDYKTVDSLALGQQFAVDEQLLTYAFAVKEALGIRVAECRHTQLRRVKRTARATPPFYGRQTITPSDEQLESHERSLRGAVTDLVATAQALENGGDPSTHAYPNAVPTCGWDCDFLAICAMHDDGSDLEGVRETLYIKRNPAEKEKETEDV